MLCALFMKITRTYLPVISGPYLKTDRQYLWCIFIAIGREELVKKTDIAIILFCNTRLYSETKFLEGNSLIGLDLKNLFSQKDYIKSTYIRTIHMI